jgi:hypothetical protein
MLEIAIAPNSRSHGREISLGAHMAAAVIPANIKKLSIVLKK